MIIKHQTLSFLKAQMIVSASLCGQIVTKATLNWTLFLWLLLLKSHLSQPCVMEFSFEKDTKNKKLL